MSHSHRHSNSSNYYKDYHSGDPYNSKRRVEGSSKSYGSSTSYSGERAYDDKKYHSTGSSSYHPYSSSSTSASHQRYEYEKTSSGSFHYGDHHQGSASHSGRYKSYDGSKAHGGLSRSSASTYSSPRKANIRSEYRKPYERVSSSSSTVRRVPPPRSPPSVLPPLMKISTSTSSSSRYRQAPPEDRHHRSTVTVPSRVSIGSSSGRKDSSVISQRNGRRSSKSRTDSDEASKSKKRSAGTIDGEIERKPKKKKDEHDISERQEENVIREDAVDEETRRSEQVDEGVKDENQRREPRKDKPLLKLHCVYCDFRCVSYKDFSQHTRSLPHSRVITGFIDSNRRRLDSLKSKVKEQQLELEKALGEKCPSDTTSYCRVCEIDLRCDPKEHEADDIHNEIKSLSQKKCDVCDVDFRLWKVYFFHTVSLEHVKRQALRQMKETQNPDFVQGTNMTAHDIGLDLMEQKNVIFCKACIRYFPFREENTDQFKMKHCMTLTHLKIVEDYTNRMKYLEKRTAEQKDREEKRRAEKKSKHDELSNDGKSKAPKTEKSEKNPENPNPSTESEEIENEMSAHDVTSETVDTGEFDDDRRGSEKSIKGPGGTDDLDDDAGNQDEHDRIEDAFEDEEENDPEMDDEEPDEDEIQLHADEDDDVDAPTEDE